MAEKEYIERGVLLQDLALTPDYWYKGRTINAILGEQPVEDVVPRVEVERLEQILNSYALQYGTVQDQHEAIYKIKREMAKEIFAEITNKLLLIVYLGADGKWHTRKNYSSQLNSFVEDYLDLIDKYTNTTDTIAGSN